MSERFLEELVQEPRLLGKVEYERALDWDISRTGRGERELADSGGFGDFEWLIGWFEGRSEIEVVRGAHVVTLESGVGRQALVRSNIGIGSVVVLVDEGIDFIGLENAVIQSGLDGVILCGAESVTGLLLLSDGRFWRIELPWRSGSGCWGRFCLLVLGHVMRTRRTSLLSECLLLPRESESSLSEVIGSQLPEAISRLVSELNRTENWVNGVGSGSKWVGEELLRSLVLLVLRTMFCVYAESRGLLPVENEVYGVGYGLLNGAEECRRRGRVGGYWSRTKALFRLIYGGIEHPALNMPGYYGELFAPGNLELLEEWSPRDGEWLDFVESFIFDLRERRRCRLDWLSYEPEILGHLYQATLNYELIKENRKWSLETISGQRRTGSFYTPVQVAESLVAETLKPLVYCADSGELKEPEQLLRLRICDFAAGSGALLVEVARQLANYLVRAWHRRVRRVGNGSIPALPYGRPMVEFSEDALPYDQPGELLNCARRLVVERCVYGVDINPIAIEIARTSLWLLTASRDRALSFVNHAVVVGDSLQGLTSGQLYRGDFALIKEKLPLFREAFVDRLRIARLMREEITEILVFNNDQLRTKQKLLNSASESLERMMETANEIVTVLRERPGEFEQLISEILVGVNEGRKSADGCVVSGSELGGAKMFHWPIEFPEVFSDMASEVKSGFDAIVANPPYCGARGLDRLLGVDYHRYLKRYLHRVRLGGLDLCVFFLYRAAQLLKQGGVIGLLTTSSIVEGSNRTRGVLPLLESGWRIFGARTQFEWPGRANLDVCMLQLSKRSDLAVELDGCKVARISSRLDTRADVEAKSLRDTLPVRAFQGSSPGAVGFQVAASIARDWLRANAKLSTVLKPYFRGKELQTSERILPDNWIVDFRDMCEEEASSYGEAYTYVSARVRERRGGRGNWWRHTNYRPGLYGELAGLKRTLVKARISPWHVLEIVPADWCFADGLIVYPTDSLVYLGLYQSTVHEIWCRHNSSKLQRSNRYSIRDAFDTFPVPLFSVRLEVEISELVVQLLFQRRIAQEQLNCGLSAIYRELNSGKTLDAELEVLRGIHDELDKLILESYGWEDLNFEKEYRKSRVGVIRTFKGDIGNEILDRLLEKNLLQSGKAECVVEGGGDKRSKLVI